MRLGPIGRSARPNVSPAASGTHRGIESLPAVAERPVDERGFRASHVLVCVAAEQGDCDLIRQGRVLAGLVDGRLTVLYAFRVGAERRQRDALRADRSCAHAVGAQLVELPAYSAADGIAEYARARAVTHIVLREAQASEALLDRLRDVDWCFVLSGNRPGPHD